MKGLAIYKFISSLKTNIIFGKRFYNLLHKLTILHTVMYVLKYLNYDLRETWRFANEKCTVHKLLFSK